MNKKNYLILRHHVLSELSGGHFLHIFTGLAPDLNAIPSPISMPAADTSLPAEQKRECKGEESNSF